MTQYKNTSFLTELLISVLVFSVSCAILFQVFTASILMAKDTRNQSQANAKVASIMETLRENEVADAYPRAQQLDDGSYVMFYHERWGEAAREQATFAILFQVDDEIRRDGRMRDISASVLAYDAASVGEEIFAMRTSWYQQGLGD